MRIGVFAGSFNPVHNGHIHIINYLLNNNYVDKVLVLPTPNYWDKNNLIDTKLRVEMLKYFENDNVIIDDIHNKYEYTYQVMESLKKDYKEDELYLIIGSDNLEKFHLWQHYDEILNNKLIVLNRGKIIKNKQLEDYENNIIYIDEFNYIDVSSTDVRNGNFNNVDERVVKYIKKKHLYDN